MSIDRASRPQFEGLRQVVNDENPHLGGNITYGDPFTYCPSVWDYMTSRFCIRSVLDLGSGGGHASYYFHNKGIPVIAVDGLEDNVKSAIYPTLKVDLHDAAVICKVDLVYCHEVVEHIQEAHTGNVVRSMQSGSIVLMSHGLPDQKGYHHVNLQPPEYWIAKLEKAGFALLSEDTARVRQLAELDGAMYMSRTGLVFANYG